MKTRFNKIFSIFAVFFFCLTTFTAGAADIINGAKIYFDASKYPDITKQKVVQLMVGHSSWSQGYKMDKVAGYDNIYVVTMPQWDGCTEFCFLGADSEWGGENDKIANRKTWAPAFTSNISINSNVSGTVSFSGNPLQRIDNCLPQFSYVLMGVNKDWTTGIELKQNPKNNGEYMLLEQPIDNSKDAIKVVKKTPCGDDFYDTVKDSPCSAKVSNDGNGNIKLPTGTYDFYFKDGEIYITPSPSSDKYYLMGVDGDWTTGIELEPKGDDEMVKLGQKISKATDQVKIVKKTPCGDEFYADVKVVSPVPFSGGGSQDAAPNIVLEDGTYNFYFDKNTNQIYISGTIDNANVVYLDPKVDNSVLNWESDNARFAVYYYKKGTEPVQAGWVSAKKDDNGLYYAQFPAAYDTYIWCRMDPNSGVNNWDGRWNQTDKIAYDADKPLTKLTSFGGPDKAEDKAASYQMINCTFPAIIPGEPVMVRINQSVESDPCNYLFKSFEDAWEVLKQNKDLCTVNGDAVTLKHPVNMLVTYVGEAYKGATAVEHTGGHVPTKVIMFKDINPNGGEPLVITTADPRGNRAVLVHPVVRDCKNITFDRLDIVGDKETKDNAMDIGVDMGETAHSMENMALIPRPDDAEPSNITIQNCKVESWGRNALHVVGAKGLHIENNEFFTRYDYSGTYDENVWAVDWAGTIKFVNSTDIKFLRNSSEGTLATSLFIQGCKRLLVMNNVFWNDNAVDFSGIAEYGRTVASVRLVTYNNNDLIIENIGIYYNTFYIKDNEVGDAKYDHFDFFRLGGYMQYIDTPEEKAVFDPSTIRFQYNNCYSYDDDIAGNNKDENQPVKFYLQSFGKTDYNWCQSFKYNNFWSEYDKDQEEKDPNHVASNFEVGIFCTGDKETYNAYIDMRGQVCATDPGHPGALVVKGSGLNIGTVITKDVSGLGADKIFTDRLNGNVDEPIRPTIVVDNSNESLSPSDHIYKEPGTINFYTSPIVASQTTDVHVSSVALDKNSKVYLSIVDGDVGYFVITDDAGQPLQTDAIGTYLTTDNNGSLDNEPLFVTFKRPNGQTKDATFSAFLQIQPASDQNLKLLIPLKGHNTVQVKDIKGAWTVGAFQQREQKPVKTIIWSGSKSTDWDNRNNWYKEDGTVVTCLDVLDADLTVIIPSKNSENYITPDGGIINYPTLPAISNEYDFKNARTNNWNGEQVNAGSNASASTTKVANKIYLEYGASLVGVEQLNKGVERYTEVEQEFIARRDDWLLVGTVVRPWNKDEWGHIVEVEGSNTRTAISGDYYKWHLPQVYMHEAIASKNDMGGVDVTWDRTFPDLDVVLPQDRAFAVYVPNEYGPNFWTAKRYNKEYGTNYNPDEPMRYSFTGRFYNEANLPVYEDLKAGVPVMLTNTYPANINAMELAKEVDGTVLVYSYLDKSFYTIEQDSKDDEIQAQHSFAFMPNVDMDLQIKKEWLLNTAVTHRSAEVELPFMRIEMRNAAKQTASNVYIGIDENKTDVPNLAVDAPKLFASETNSLPDLYVMRYDEKWAGVHIPTAHEPIPLGVRVSQKNQTFTISLLRTNMAYDVMLEDRMEGKTYNLSQGETCQVNGLSKGECEGRFFINLGQTDDYIPDQDVTTAVDDVDNQAAIAIYTQGNDMVVSCTNNVELQRIVVIDMVGRHQVYQVSGRYVVLSLPVNNGMYVIQAIGDNAMKTKKIQVK